MFKIGNSTLDSQIPNMEGFYCFAKYCILLILGIRLLIFKRKIYKPFFEHLFGNYRIASIFSSSKFLNERVIKEIMLLFIVVRPGLMFTARKSNKINLKNKSSLINQIFARAR